ncbi:MAG TPA: serine hydrolase domain-containing protein [Gemmatimonadaceae bacterium]
MTTKTLVSVLIAVGSLSSPLRGQTTVATSDSRIKSGFAVDRLARIDQMMQRYVDSNQIAGAVGLVMRDGKVVYEHAVGWADKESGRRMTTDAIFRIASQTKALTSTSVLILMEEGRLGLDDPVSRYIPQFAHTTVATRSDTGRVIMPAKREITIRDLLTHTAGISYGTDSIVAPLYSAKALGPAAGWGWYTADKNEPICTTIERLATLPFVAQPGERWVYGYNTDILGCVVERVSGIPLDEFIRARITQPLGMKDTFFYLPPDKRQRLAAVYMSDSTGGVRRAPDGPRGQGNYVDGPRRSFAGGAGLLSTAHDYARLLQMLLNGGELDGVRILAPKTIELMTTNQVGNLFPSSGEGFGLAFGINERVGGNGLASVGSWGWGGAYGSMYNVDPKERMLTLFMIQQLPNRADVASRFPTVVYQALVEPRH